MKKKLKTGATGFFDRAYLLVLKGSLEMLKEKEKVGRSEDLNNFSE
jgi:hypothetical protein